MESRDIWIWCQVEFEIRFPADHHEQIGVGHRKGFAYQIGLVPQPLFGMGQPALEVLPVYLLRGLRHMRME